jgi:hypothetical protein
VHQPVDQRDDAGGVRKDFVPFSERAIGGDQRAFVLSWLRVSGTAKMPQIDQSICHQLHTVVALLFELKP